MSLQEGADVPTALLQRDGRRPGVPVRIRLSSWSGGRSHGVVKRSATEAQGPRSKRWEGLGMRLRRNVAEAVSGCQGSRKKAEPGGGPPMHGPPLPADSRLVKLHKGGGGDRPAAGPANLGYWWLSHCRVRTDPGRAADPPWRARASLALYTAGHTWRGGWAWKLIAVSPRTIINSKQQRKQ